MDGIVEYFIPTNGRNIKISLLENRTFRNPKLYEKKLKNKGLSTATTGDRTGPLYIQKKTILDELSNIKLSELTKNSKNILMKNDTNREYYFFDTVISFCKY